MKNQIHIKFNSKGFEQILCSNGAREVCEKAGAEIQNRANSNLGEYSDSAGFAMSSRNVKAYGSQRNMTFVYTTDGQSMRAEAENKALSKAVN